ncbi:MAG: hypothetical protein EP338_10045 [Bacteroidetes bacterium]|nr:MAG: hypothetical protein EP338_10045 [Bacteroidota bacterium]
MFFTFPKEPSSTGQSTEKRPSITRIGNKLFCAFKENTSSKIDVICSTDNGKTWEGFETPNNLIYTGQTTDVSPSICALGTNLYIVFKEDTSPSIDVIYSKDQGKSWDGFGTSNGLVQTGQGTDCGPSICSFDEKLYIAFKESTSTKIDVICSGDYGRSWNALVHTGQGTEVSPSICEMGGNLYIAFKEATSPSIDVICSKDNGNSWDGFGTSNGLVQTGQGTDCAPSICALEGKLYIAFKEATSKRIDIIYTQSSTKDWSHLQHVGETTNIGPALTSNGSNIDSNLFILFQAEDSSNRLLQTVGSFHGHWMELSLDTIGNKTLKDICIPGSHDAGMSKSINQTVGAHECNTVTQTLDILYQLQAGARIFDIRPVISGGKYLTGHYTHAGKILNHQGACGQSIDEIITQINAFTEDRKELIILQLSHDLNTDVGRSYRALNQEEWNELLNKIKYRLNRLSGGFGHENLTSIKLKTWVGQEWCVLVIVDPSDKEVNIYDAVGKDKGFYPNCSLPVPSVYTGTNNLEDMINDQVDKLSNKIDGSYFQTSWTLTQSDDQTVTCRGWASSILELATEANKNFNDCKPLFNEIIKGKFPNIIWFDNIGNVKGILNRCEEINSMAPREIAVLPEIVAGNWQNFYGTAAPFELNGKPYIFLQTDTADNHWCISELALDASTVNYEIVAGNWQNFYGTAAPFVLNGKPYILLQTNTADNHWCISELALDASIVNHEIVAGNWQNFYGTAVPFELNGKPYIFLQTDTADNHWCISELALDASIINHEIVSGNWEHYYNTAVPFELNGRLLVFLQTNTPDNHWRISELTLDASANCEILGGTWQNFYGTSVPFQLGGKSYVFLQTDTADNRWCISELNVKSSLKG